MKILLIFTLCLISDGGVAVKVTGYSGGRIIIKCTYDTQYTQNNKYFCNGSVQTLCSDLIKTEDKDMWINSGRFSLFDDTKSAEFRVMIRDLTVQDTGTYHCAVDKDLRTVSYTPVKLNVKEDVMYKKFISETVQVGGDLNVSCEYPESLTTKTKFFCQMKQEPDVCSYKLSVNESSKYVKMRKFSLYDDRTKHIFSVSMTDISEEDSGVYWCGAEADWNSDHGYKVYFTQINVTLTGLTLIQAKVSSSAAATSPFSSSSPLSSSSSSLSAATSPFSSSSSSSLSTSLGFQVSTVIIVSVILLLLLIGLIFLTLTLRKRTKLKARSQCSVQNSGNDRRVSLHVCEYEEIKDISVLPTSPCDGPIYSTAELPKNPPDQDIYSMTQLPTAVSSEKSAEGLIYTTVHFHNNVTSTNDADLQKDVFSEYASVSHVTSHV